MPNITELDEKAPEGGTFGIRCDFVEKMPDGDVPITPNPGLKWSLFDSRGTVINGKEDVPISPAQSIYIVLTGDDLALAGGPTKRYVTVEGTYDGILGTGLPLISEVSFQIKNLVGKP